MKLLIVSICGVFFLILTACSKVKPITIAELSGFYQVNYSHGREILELRNDGTYTQQYFGKDGSHSFINRGKWNTDSKYDTIDLIDGIIVDTGFDKLRTVPEKGVWSLNIIRRTPLSLSMNSDRALMFEKQK